MQTDRHFPAVSEGHGLQAGTLGEGVARVVHHAVEIVLEVALVPAVDLGLRRLGRTTFRL